MMNRIRREYRHTKRAVLAIVGSPHLLANDGELAKSLVLRAPDLDALGYIQAELLQRKRVGAVPSERSTLTQGIQLTISGVAAGLRNTG